MDEQHIQVKEAPLALATDLFSRITSISQDVLSTEMPSDAKGKKGSLLNYIKRERGKKETLIKSKFKAAE
ncbi:Eukaryotic Translation Initiation Factor 2-Alpha Kinase 3 [Manis pentadactyla]|nr:Eukaryotic Translation Initiation Factor 2-Alpha Kinase 3 [Manis pentadactyla]